MYNRCLIGIHAGYLDGKQGQYESRATSCARISVINRKLTYHKLVHELECVYTYIIGKKTVWSEISERQSTIFKFLDIKAPAEPKNIKIKKESVKKKNLN